MAESNEFWKKALQKAREERQQLVEQRLMFDAMLSNLELEREANEVRIRQLEKAMGELANLTGDCIFSALLPIEGLTSLPIAEACRRVLKSADRHWTAVAVRDALLEQKYDLAAHQNPLATIHSILKRFVESGEVITSGNGRQKTYRWKDRNAVRLAGAVCSGLSEGRFGSKPSKLMPNKFILHDRVKIVPGSPTHQEGSLYYFTVPDCDLENEVGSPMFSSTPALLSALGISLEGLTLEGSEEDQKD